MSIASCFPFSPRLFEGVAKVLKREAGDGESQMWLGRKDRERKSDKKTPAHYSSRMAGVPTRTIFDKAEASQFARRMQP